MSYRLTSGGVNFVTVDRLGNRCRGKQICLIFKDVLFNSKCIDLVSSSIFKAFRSDNTNIVPITCSIFFIHNDNMQKGDLFVCFVLPKRSCLSPSFFEEILSSKESKALLIPATIYMAAFKNTFLLGRFIDSHCLNIDTSSSALYREFNFVRYLNFFDVK